MVRVLTKNFFPLLLLGNAPTGLLFPWEEIQLTDDEIERFPALAYGDTSRVSSPYTGPKCKVGPNDAAWPNEAEWATFNTSLSGALIKTIPPGAVCYQGPNFDAAQCQFLVRNASSTTFYDNNPVSTYTEWAEGNTCQATLSPTGNCTQGGFPEYIVNATTVKHVQMAVNFARNRNLRLVIKNTGHDFAGRGTGLGALSIWTHNLKTFDFMQDYTSKSAKYAGRAVHTAAGVEAWELYGYMDQYNITMASPGGNTVGAVGGWMAGGGHNMMASTIGLGCDQVLALRVVTADGRFVEVDPEKNSDLFFAMLGGGSGTYGVVTSAVIKAHEAVGVATAPLNFNVNPASTNPTVLNNTESFWEGVKQFFYFTKTVLDAGGSAFSNVINTGNGTYAFSNTFYLPGKSINDTSTLLQPLYTTLNNLGIPITNTPATILTPSYPLIPHTPGGGAPGQLRFASRLFPRKNWEDATLWNATFASIRAVIEAGYLFHGVSHSPTPSVAGYPGAAKTSINPVWRSALMHADIFDVFYASAGANLTAEGPQAVADAKKASHARMNEYVDLIRKATPDGGAYYNEADVEEPGWQRSFFGVNYERLVGIKKARDPWGLFWATRMPGSEDWAVVTADGLPTQNGPLCRTDGLGR